MFKIMQKIPTDSIHLKVESTKQWRVVQGSEKQVGEEPSLLSLRTIQYCLFECSSQTTGRSTW